MPNTPKMNWQYPSENQDPFFDVYEGQILAQDTDAYAVREDNHLIFTGGGTLSLTLATNTFAWTEDIVIVNLLNGGIRTVSAGSIVIASGDVVYVTVARPISGTKTLTAAKATSVGADRNKFWLALRKGDDVYVRDGQKIAGV